GVDPPAVVLDRQLDAATAGARREAQPAGRRLAGRLPLGGGFEAVVDRVGDQVAQRAVEFTRDATVEPGLAPFDLDLDLPAETAGEVARVARQRLQGGLDRRDLQRQDRLDLLLPGARQTRLERARFGGDL